MSGAPSAPPSPSAAAFRRGRAARVAVAPSRRLPDVRRGRRDALRRQGARPQEARVELLPEGRARDADRADARAGRSGRNHGHALRGRGAAAGKQPDQGPRAALQHPVPRRQELPVRLPDRRGLPAAALPPRQARPPEPVFRPVPERRRGARGDGAAAEGVPAAHLREHGVRQPLAPVHAPPDPALQRAVRRPRPGGRLRRRRQERRALPAGQDDRGARAAEGADGGGERRARVRARRAHPRQDHAAHAAAVPAVRRERDGRRHRRRRRGGRAGARRRQRGDDPRRSARRRPQLLSPARRRRRAGRGRAGVPRAALRRAAGAADDRRPGRRRPGGARRRAFGAGGKPRADRRQSRRRAARLARDGDAERRVRDPPEARPEGDAGGPPRCAAGGARDCRKRRSGSNASMSRTRWASARSRPA